MPIHTVYVGAHAFDEATPRRLAEASRRFFAERFPDPLSLEALGIEGELADEVHRRVAARLAAEPIEDLRIDFEDGYGERGDDDEDRDAVRTAAAARGAHARGELPAGFGLRVRSFEPATRERAVRTLGVFAGEIFAGELVAGGAPAAFVVTLPKITHPREVDALSDLLDERETTWGLRPGSLRVELMAETPQSIFARDGRLALPDLLAAARGRAVGVHLGVFDYTAALGVAGPLQGPRHPVCDVALGLLQAGLAAHPGVDLSHGSSRVDPAAVDADRFPAAAREVYRDVRHALDRAVYRGWDLHPSHVVLRRIAVVAFYLQQLARLDATGALDDAATSAALRAFLHRARACGALDDTEIPEGALDR